MSKQTLNDRLTAAKHALARERLARAVCKATTEEAIGPKRKHLDYLLQCLNDPDVSNLKLVNLLIKRTQHTSWVVAFKALITIHHLMCYGNEFFIQCLVLSTHFCNQEFLANSFLDKVGDQSCDMSTLIKRYAKYVNEKAVSCCTVGFDFCKCKREDGDDILRQMDTGKLLKTLSALQNLVDALLEFDCSTNDLCSKVVNACFVLLFRDLIRLTACYNHGIVCLLERYEEEESEEHARKGLDIYKKFLIRMDKIAEFFKLAKDSARIHPYGGIDKDDIPEHPKIPNSILEAMEQHIASLGGNMESASAAASPSEIQLENRSSPTEAMLAMLKQWANEEEEDDDSSSSEDEEDDDSSSSEDEEDDDSSSSEDEDDDDLSTTLKNSPQNQEIAKVDFIAKALTDIDIEELTLFPYKDLQNASKNFLNKTIEKGGCKIGEGSFGTVYKVVMADSIVAVKRLKDPVDEQFITELKILTRYRHENLLPLLGCSVDGPTCCLVYEYMANGSLEDRLACLGKSKPLSWRTRLSIAYGSALGINHMHTYGETPMVHRDIKSANILLDENFVPKVGDFGLVRISSRGNSTVMAMTSNVCGTSVYMAREAFYGDASIKLDTYSFGVVLLELLTGLPPFDVEREYRDLVTYMEDCDNILTKLDPQTDWCSIAAKELYAISKQCLSESKKVRPAISQILGDLKKCLSHASHDGAGQQTSDMGIFAKVLSLIPI